MGKLSPGRVPAAPWEGTSRPGTAMSQEPRREQHAGAPPATVPWSSVVVGRTDEVDAQAWFQRYPGRACAHVALREDPSALDATLIEVTRARRSGSASWQ